MLCTILTLSTSLSQVVAVAVAVPTLNTRLYIYIYIHLSDYSCYRIELLSILYAQQSNPSSAKSQIFCSLIY